MDDVTVAVATYGDPAWIRLAHERALPSAFGQGAPVVNFHGDSLADARNACLEAVATPFVIYLDADDELTPGYVDAMRAGSADVRAPSVQYVRDGREWVARVPRVHRHRHACDGDCLPSGNWIAVGAMARVELLRQAGGWRDEPVYEDWSLWLRAWRAGASVEAIPGAVYRAHVRPDSRNRGTARDVKDRWHRLIGESCSST